ncbi:MAG: hypothetical protein ACTSRU_12970 [Candidatus Hodarchaeales archaeon]
MRCPECGHKWKKKTIRQIEVTKNINEDYNLDSPAYIQLTKRAVKLFVRDALIYVDKTDIDYFNLGSSIFVCLGSDHLEMRVCIDGIISYFIF